MQNVSPNTINPLASRWTSSNTDVAYVCADGTVVAIGEGTATITCTMGDATLACQADQSSEVTQTCEVTVGDAVVATEPKFTSAQLLLGEQIKMRFWLTVPTGFDDTNASAVFSIEGKGTRTSQPITIAEATPDQPNSRYAFDFELSSIEMAEPITCTFTYGENETVTYSYSVKDYVEAALDMNLADAEKACMKAIANYGHYMQPYLASAHDWTIGTDYAEMGLSYELDANAARTGVQNFKPSLSGEGASDAGVTCSLSLDSYTTFDLFYAPAGGAELNATATFNNQQYTAEKVGSRYRIRVDRIKAAQLGDTVSVTGSVGGKSFTVNIEPLTYAYVVFNGTYGDVANNAIASLYHYYSTAKQLLASQS